MERRVMHMSIAEVEALERFQGQFLFNGIMHFSMC